MYLFIDCCIHISTASSASVAPLSLIIITNTNISTNMFLIYHY